MTAESLKKELDALLDKCTRERHTLNGVLGRKGEFTSILKRLGNLSTEDRRSVGVYANNIREELRKVLID